MYDLDTQTMALRVERELDLARAERLGQLGWGRSDRPGVYLRVRTWIVARLRTTRPLHEDERASAPTVVRRDEGIARPALPGS